MANNSIRTSKPVASKAGKALSSSAAPKSEKTLAASALTNRKSSSKKK